MKGSSSRILFATITLPLSLAAVVGGLWYVKVVRADMVTLSNELATEVARIDGLSSLERALRETTGVRDVVDAHFVPSDNVVAYIELIEGVARGWNLEVEVQSVDTVFDEAGIIGIISADVSVDGSWQGVVGAIRELELLPYHVDLTSVRISRSEGGRWSAQFTVVTLMN